MPLRQAPIREHRAAQAGAPQQHAHRAARRADLRAQSPARRRGRQAAAARRERRGQTARVPRSLHGQRTRGRLARTCRRAARARLGAAFEKAPEIAQHRTAIAQIAAEVKLPIAEFRRVVQIVQRGEREASRAKKEMVEANLRLVVVDCQEIREPRPAIPRPDPRGQYWADEGGRQIRIPSRLQVLDLRHLVDPPGDHPLDATRRARSAFRCT